MIEGKDAGRGGVQEDQRGGGGGHAALIFRLLASVRRLPVAAHLVANLTDGSSITIRAAAAGLEGARAPLFQADW